MIDIQNFQYHLKQTETVEICKERQCPNRSLDNLSREMTKQCNLHNGITPA